MPPEQEESARRLERLARLLSDASFSLAALAVVRRGDANVREAARNIADYTAGIMTVDEAKLARELEELAENGYVELHDGRYRITIPGKRHMYMMLKQWNRYVDAMNNLWGCYYGT